ncbi:MAG: tRNA uridine-5-carboxymethylaminomethyl(34) synthesis GTPase MnmE [Rickettsiales bacterium]|nr:tRNA uridine-5-carboxymethylaminomethyl(34) synthesis GTPase MnmE [Rickettsiales bacterium]
MSELDTIFARATASGRAGVSVLRISGKDALKACEHFGRTEPPTPRHAILHSFKVDEEFIDSGLMLFFQGPLSFTGEDIIEFQMHGGVAIMNRMMKELSALSSFRLAKPGEFSQRAFLNQKMDLTEAEGLVDIINAETERQRIQASRLTQGHAADFFEALRNRVLEPMALIEAYIDFPEEEIPEEVTRQIDESIVSLKEEITYQLSSGQSAERLREGFVVLLMGKPNSGKSSLLNAIVKREAAIVTDIPGTTRDLIEIGCEINGLPVTLIDTAGLRESEDAIEQQGVAKARLRAKEADIILYLRDAEDMQSEDVIVSEAPIYRIATKIDLAPCPVFESDYQISTRSLDGLDELMDAMSRDLENKLPASDCFALHQRHRQLLQDSLKALELFDESSALEIRAEHLREAATVLGDIIGSHSVEDLLDIIFSSFCIGK